MKKAAMIALTMLWMAGAGAEQSAGVEVYPNAKADAAVAKSLKAKMSLTASTYRTSDPVEKVTEFYRKQKLEEMPGTTSKGSMFSAKSGTTLTIQNPWMDMDTGKVQNDTLISIVPKRK